MYFDDEVVVKVSNSFHKENETKHSFYDSVKNSWRFFYPSICEYELRTLNLCLPLALILSPTSRLWGEGSRNSKISAVVPRIDVGGVTPSTESSHSLKIFHLFVVERNLRTKRKMNLDYWLGHLRFGVG